METPCPAKKEGLTHDQNQRLKKLIRTKLYSLRGPRHSAVTQSHRCLADKAHSSFHAPQPKPLRQRQYQIVGPHESLQFQLPLRQKPSGLVVKARKCIAQARQYLGKLPDASSVIDMRAYLEMFQSNEDSQKKRIREFLKRKRESMQLLPPCDLTKSTNFGGLPEVKTEDQISEMNAKIRRRLNHKKIISLYRNA